MKLTGTVLRCSSPVSSAGTPRSRRFGASRFRRRRSSARSADSFPTATRLRSAVNLSRDLLVKGVARDAFDHSINDPPARVGLAGGSCGWHSHPR
jgi:hypothetical protein